MLELILLQAQGATETTMEQQPAGGGWSFWIMMLLIFVVFYFFMIRPQTKKQKELQQQRDAIKPGDKVITSGGIHGRAKEVRDDAMLVEVASGITLKISKEAIFAVPEEDTKNKKEDKKEDKKD